LGIDSSTDGFRIAFIINPATYDTRLPLSMQPPLEYVTIQGQLGTRQPSKCHIKMGGSKRTTQQNEEIEGGSQTTTSS